MLEEQRFAKLTLLDDGRELNPYMKAWMPILAAMKSRRKPMMSRVVASGRLGSQTLILEHRLKNKCAASMARDWRFNVISCCACSLAPSTAARFFTQVS